MTAKPNRPSGPLEMSMFKMMMMSMVVCVVLPGCSKSEPGAADPKTEPKAEAAKPKADEVKLSDPSTVATAFLTAFKAKDLEGMKKHASGMMKRQIDAMITNREKSDYKSFFSSWHDDVSRGDGTVKELRYRKEMMPSVEAVAYFVDSDKTEGKIVTLVMRHFRSEDWGFATFESMKKTKFESYSKTPITK